MLCYEHVSVDGRSNTFHIITIEDESNMEKVCCTTLPASLPLAWTRADRGLFLGMVEDAVQLTSTISTLGSMVYTRALLTRLERRQEIYPDHMGEYMYPPKHSSTTVCPRCRHSRGVITARGPWRWGRARRRLRARKRPPAAAGAGVARASGPVRQRRRSPQRVGKVAGWLPEAVQESRPTQVETK